MFEYISLANVESNNPKIFTLRNRPNTQNHDEWATHKLRKFQDQQKTYKKLIRLIPKCYCQKDCHSFHLREWEMLAGHWLMRYIGAHLNIYDFISSGVMAGAKKLLVSEVNKDNSHLFVLNSEKSIRGFDSLLWREAIAQNIAKSCFPTLTIEVSGAPYRARQPELESSSRFLPNAYEAFSTLLRPISKFAKYFIFKTYLPFSLEILLSFKLNGLPQIWSLKSSSGSKTKFPTSNFEILGDSFSSFSKLENCMASTLTQALPKSYHLNEAVLAKIYKNTNWPKKPEVMFTSNAFDTNDNYKLYAIAQMRRGAKHVVGQHGNNYGTHVAASPSIEERTSDAFITWGRRLASDTSKAITGFVLKNPRGKKIAGDPNGKGILVQLHRSEDYEPWDVYHDYAMYFSTQLAFVAALDSRIRKLLQVRLHSAEARMGWNEKEKWEDKFPGLEIVSPRVSFAKNMVESRILIFSYDSTGILEALSTNFPFVAFWEGGLEHLVDSAKTDYQALIDAKILHMDAYSAALHINSVWNDVQSWWNSPGVQNARKSFSEKYARLEGHPVSHLATKLKGMTS